ncbi:hypothetical protein GCM10023333_23140 [Ferrimonas pelagia]|uniref:Uncharacterized protein n=1 Tax=Ferrimonas pelagia TaxID=1177826 RepID=A0ABP9EZX5_9GAMM
MPFCSMIAAKTGAECRWGRADRELGGVIFESGWRFSLWENGEFKGSETEVSPQSYVTKQIDSKKKEGTFMAFRDLISRQTKPNTESHECPTDPISIRIQRHRRYAPHTSACVKCLRKQSRRWCQLDRHLHGTRVEQ